MLGESHFFKPRADVELDDVLGGHPVIKDKHHRNQPFDNRRIAVAAQGDNAGRIQRHHDPYLALTALNNMLRAVLRVAQRRQPLAQLNDIEILLFPVGATAKIAQQFIFVR